MKNLSSLFFLILFIPMFVLWAVVLTSAQSNILSITRFGGERGDINPLNLKPGQAVQCINWDLSKSVGALVKRDGFSHYTTVKDTDGDSLRGIFGYTNSNGKKRLFATYNSPTGIYDIIANGAVFEDSLSNAAGYYYQRKGATPSWAVYNDILIHANGHNRPVRWNGTGYDVLVEVPPGHLDLAPMVETATTAQLLDGDYYYAWRAAMPCSVQGDQLFGQFDDSMNLSGPSWQIHVDSDWVWIFRRQDADTTSGCDPDSTIIQLGRTRNGAVPQDSFFLVYTKRWINSSTAAGTRYIDSIPDCSLGAGTHVFIGFVDTVTHAADSATDSLYELGAPVWLGTDTVPSVAGNWDGISEGMRVLDTIWTATKYFIAFYDSSTLMVSDSGPSIRVPSFATTMGEAKDTTRDYAIRLGLPTRTSNEIHLWRLLCRAKETQDKQTVTDTLFRENFIRAGWWPGGWELPPLHYQYYDPDYYCRWGDGSIDPDHSMRVQRDDGSYWCRAIPQVPHDTIIVTTETSTWRIIDTIKDASNIYLDSLSWMDWANKPSVKLGMTQKPMNYPVVLRDRCYMAEGSRIYYSSIDKDGSQIGYWPVGNRFDVNANDKDEITALHVYGDNLIVFKNDSWYWIKEIEYGLHADQEMDSYYGVGCVAPHSIINIPGGGFVWLHTSGIYEYRTALQSEYKETGGNLGSISGPIQHHLDNYGIDDLRECHTWLTDDDRNLVFSFPTLDTSFAYSLGTGEWGLWTFAARQTTRYDTTYQTDLRPSNDVLFITQAHDSIYKYGGVKTDLSDEVGGWAAIDAASTWESGPLFKSPDLWGISAYGLWKESDDTADISVMFYDHDGTLKKTITDSSQYRFRKFGISPGEAYFWQVMIYTENVDSLAIQGLDLWPEYKGKAQEY